MKRSTDRFLATHTGDTFFYQDREGFPALAQRAFWK